MASCIDVIPWVSCPIASVNGMLTTQFVNGKWGFVVSCSNFVEVPRRDCLIQRLLDVRLEDKEKADSVYCLLHVQQTSLFQVEKDLSKELQCILSYISPESFNADVLQ